MISFTARLPAARKHWQQTNQRAKRRGKNGELCEQNEFMYRGLGAVKLYCRKIQRAFFLLLSFDDALACDMHYL